MLTNLLKRFKLLVILLIKRCFLFLKKKNTALGRVLYVLYLMLLVFFIHYILSIIVNPYGYLKEFVAGVSNSIEILLTVFLYHKKREIFDYLENLPLFLHIAFSLTLLGIYYKSIRYIWTHKTNYLNSQKP